MITSSLLLHEHGMSIYLVLRFLVFKSYGFPQTDPTNVVLGLYLSFPNAHAIVFLISNSPWSLLICEKTTGFCILALDINSSVFFLSILGEFRENYSKLDKSSVLYEIKYLQKKPEHELESSKQGESPEQEVTAPGADDAGATRHHSLHCSAEHGVKS